MEPLSALINRKVMLPSQKTNYIAVDMHYLSNALRDKVGQIFVDEAWYGERYPDILGAVQNGKLKSLSEHYVLYGYYEHRMPYYIKVDEEWYLTEYSDLQKAVSAGTFETGLSFQRNQ
jgi:hypothetical protein